MTTTHFHESRVRRGAARRRLGALGVRHRASRTRSPVSTRPCPTTSTPAALAAYCLMLGDDALVYSHRLSEWCSRAPDLEEDIALANIALDLLGQARLLLARAAAADPTVVPALPEGSPVPPEDALAFFRADRRLPQHPAGRGRQRRLRRAPSSRLLLFSTWRLALLRAAAARSRDPVLAADRGEGRQGGHLPPRLRGAVVPDAGPGHRRVALADCWPALPRRCGRATTSCSPPTRSSRRCRRPRGRASTRPTSSAEVGVVLDQVLAASGVDRPVVAQVGPVAGGRGRDGRHTEALSHLLAEMQSVARAHPLGPW